MAQTSTSLIQSLGLQPTLDRRQREAEQLGQARVLEGKVEAQRVFSRARQKKSTFQTIGALLGAAGGAIATGGSPQGASAGAKVGGAIGGGACGVSSNVGPTGEAAEGISAGLGLATSFSEAAANRGAKESSKLSRSKDLLVNEKGEQDAKGKFIGTFKTDNSGNIGDFLGLKKVSRIGEDELLKGRKESQTVEAIKRKEAASGINADLDQLKRQRDVAQTQVKRLQKRKLDIDTKDIPAFQSELNDLDPIEKSFIDLGKITDELAESGKLGAISGRLSNLKDVVAPNDPLIARFNTILNIMTPFTSKSLAKNLGAQSDKDISLVQKALPMLKGTAPYNKAIVSQLLSLIADRKEAINKDIDMFTKISSDLEFSSAPRFKTFEDANNASLPSGTIIYVFNGSKYTKARVD